MTTCVGSRLGTTISILRVLCAHVWFVCLVLMRDLGFMTCKNRAVQIEVHKIDKCLELSYLLTYVHIAMLSSDSPELFSPCAQRRVVPIHLGWKKVWHVCDHHLKCCRSTSTSDHSQLASASRPHWGSRPCR